MKIVCSYCGKNIGEKDGDGVEGISHGICEVCLAKLQTEVDKTKTLPSLVKNRRYGK